MFCPTFCCFIYSLCGATLYNQLLKYGVFVFPGWWRPHGLLIWSNLHRPPGKWVKFIYLRIRYKRPSLVEVCGTLTYTTTMQRKLASQRRGDVEGPGTFFILEGNCAALPLSIMRPVNRLRTMKCITALQKLACMTKIYPSLQSEHSSCSGYFIQSLHTEYGGWTFLFDCHYSCMLLQLLDT